MQASQRSSPRPLHSPKIKPWTALDQALRATDLLLQNGGFGLIVLDLASTPAEFSWRIPMATWFRYRAACERTRTSLLLLTQHPCARSSAELVVRMQPGEIEVEGNVLTGIAYRAELDRQRFASTQDKVVSIRKLPQSVRAGAWTGRSVWATGH
jgi:recombination protein RecA